METHIQIFIYLAVAIFALVFMILLFFTSIINLLSGVPYVPTRKKYIKEIIKLADLKEGEKVFDLGCGDGRFLSAASAITKRTATGFETAPIPYLLSITRKIFSRNKFEVLMKNFYKQSLSEADVIYCYLSPEAMQKLSAKITKECKKGTRVYSNAFSIKNLVPKKQWPKNKHLPNLYYYEI
jgi:ribosomal protein L11 methylase PrmA